MEESVEILVQATTLEWTARVKKATPVFEPRANEKGVGGSLRNAWQTQIKSLAVLYQTICPMQSQFVSAKIYHHLGAMFIEQDRIHRLVIQN